MAENCDCIECALRRFIWNRHPMGFSRGDSVKVMSALGAIAGEALSKCHDSELDEFVRFMRNHRDEVRAADSSPSGRVH